MRRSPTCSTACASRSTSTRRAGRRHRGARRHRIRGGERAAQPRRPRAADAGTRCPRRRLRPVARQLSSGARRRRAATSTIALLRQGVIVRPVANYGLPEHLRVTVGLPEENRRFLAALGVSARPARAPLQVSEPLLSQARRRRRRADRRLVRACAEDKRTPYSESSASDATSANLDTARRAGIVDRTLHARAGVDGRVARRRSGAARHAGGPDAVAVRSESRRISERKTVVTDAGSTKQRRHRGSAVASRCVAAAFRRRTSDRGHRALRRRRGLRLAFSRQGSRADPDRRQRTPALSTA